MKLLSVCLFTVALLSCLPGCANEYAGQTPMQQAIHHSSFEAREAARY